ncbi:hypothetical protein ALC56_09023 [Trachymyrmex septentrionalis]|uniref:Double jelly roll-like domain-containing protein n=1 Tax=Trachymyrmex septentrionalis TaxID=34720 RepID=A0A151JUV0_9HYME|nr:hypothetical protein ALC56_09023 [Trachymyrmex septentrionalis]
MAKCSNTLPILSLLRVFGSLISGAARVAKAINDNKANGAEIDRNRNVKITITIKSYASFSRQYNDYAGLIPSDYNAKNLMTPDGYFNFCVLLSMLLGFCKDYKHVIINARHELILIRARNDNNCIVRDSATEPKLGLFKIQSLLRTLNSGRYLSMSFRSWDLYECPLLQNTTKHSWAIKTATQLEKPRAPDRKGAVGKDRHKSGGVSLRPKAPNEPGVEQRTKWKPLLVLR